MILFLCASDSELSHSVILSLDSEWMFVMIRGFGEEGGGGVVHVVEIWNNKEI